MPSVAITIPVVAPSPAPLARQMKGLFRLDSAMTRWAWAHRARAESVPTVA